MVNIVDNWPYTNLHNINLDWIIEEVKKLGYKMDTLEGYFPRISTWNNGEWDIDHDYQPNEIVTNGNDIYMAKTNVPAGVNINNTDYWLLVGTDSYITDKVSKSGDTMTGTLTAPHIRIYDAAAPMLALTDTQADPQALGAVFEDITQRRMVVRQRSADGFAEDYYLPVNTAEANQRYQFTTTKELIPWQNAGSDWLAAVAAAKMDIAICFSFAVGNSQIRLDVYMPVVELDDTYRFHFSQTAHVSGNTYHAQARARLNGLDYTGVYDGSGNQITEGITTTIYYR